MAYFVEEHYPYHKRVLLLLGPHFVWLKAQLYLGNYTMDMMDEMKMIEDQASVLSLDIAILRPKLENGTFQVS